jgi:hypothetical protein
MKALEKRVTDLDRMEVALLDRRGQWEIEPVNGHAFHVGALRRDLLMELMRGI